LKSELHAIRNGVTPRSIWRYFFCQNRLRNRFHLCKMTAWRYPQHGLLSVIYGPIAHCVQSALHATTDLGSIGRRLHEPAWPASASSIVPQGPIGGVPDQIGHHHDQLHDDHIQLPHSEIKQTGSGWKPLRPWAQRELRSSRNGVIWRSR
jgi:hypothetical protein